MARDGIGVICAILFAAVVMTIGARLNPSVIAVGLAALAWVAAILTLYFFRDPSRPLPSEDDAIFSPADGRVVEIVTEFEPLYLKDQVTRVSIFLSILDVHVNRIPLSGEVDLFRYQRGKFLAAYRHRASQENEQTVIGIRGVHCQLLFKQIAGSIARRIVCHVREGSKVVAGEKFGMIKFGSRVDISVPKKVQIQVQVGQKVQAGKTIIGKIYEKV